MDVEDEIRAVEYEPLLLPADRLSTEDAHSMWRRCGGRIQIDFPNPKLIDAFRLVSPGWIGAVSLGRGRTLRIEPRVPVASIWRMLNEVYSFGQIQLFDGLLKAEKSEDIWWGLTNLLVDGVGRRIAAGLYRGYRPVSRRQRFVRGRLDIGDADFFVDESKPVCHYRVNGPDVPENRLLVAALERVLACRLGDEGTLRRARRHYHHLRGSVSTIDYPREAWPMLTYHRLTEPYRPLHALCRAILDNAGPAFAPGEDAGIPFLVHMPTLFERYVAAWMSRSLPEGWRVQIQNRKVIDPGSSLHFRLDLALTGPGDSGITWVVDTKYGRPHALPGADDIAQVVAYATAVGAKSALLIYPSAREPYLSAHVGDVHVQTRSFPLDRSADEAGADILSLFLAQKSCPLPNPGF